MSDSNSAALVTAPPAPSRALSAGLLLVIVVVAFESVSVGTIMPRLAADLHGLNLYGWASSAFFLASLPGAVLTGLLSDRRGVAWAATLCLGLFGLGMLLVGLAPRMDIVVAGRFVEGLGVGGLNALPFVVISAAYRGNAQASMLAAISSMWLIPGVLGPLLASEIANQWSWRAVFWALLGLLLLAAPLCVLPLRQIARAGQEVGQKRILLPALGLLLASGVLVEGLRRADATTLLLLPLGLFGMYFAMRPLFPSGLWRLEPGLPAALALRGFLAFCQMGLTSFTMLALRELHHLSLREAGFMISIGGISWPLGAWMQAQLEQRRGPASRLMRIRLGLVASTAGLLVTALGLFGGFPLWAAYVGNFISGLGMGLAYNSNSLYAMNAVSAKQSGQLSGQMANIEVLMVAISAGIGGALVARTTPLGHALELVYAMNMAVSLLPWLALRRMR